MSGQLGTLLGPDLMRVDARERVLERLALAPVTRAMRRQLLIEWARQVGTRLNPGELDRVSERRGIP